MSRYQPVSHNDDDDDSLTHQPAPPTRRPNHQQTYATPASPPPSFHSRASSPHRRRSISDSDPLVSDADRTLADTFDAPSDSESEDDEHSDRRLDDRQRVMSGRPSDTTSDGGNGDRPAVERTVTQLPIFAPSTTPRRQAPVNDGVFANLSAKPTQGGDDLEEKPPTYEQAAADATPPYWENTIFSPASSSNDVYIDGLPVGSLFSFVWNGMISMSFQLVGFLLTYLLHSTHAAKNGSKAGLGITLIQYGFSLKGAASRVSDGGAKPGEGDGLPTDFTTPSDPNNHNFDPNHVALDRGDPALMINAGAPEAGGSATGFGALGASDLFAYALMIVGWFVLIRAISEYMKARRHESLVLGSPSRGLDVPVLADDEEPSRAV